VVSVLARVLQEPAHLIMASHEGEAYLTFGAPEKDSLGKPRSEFPQRRTQLGQTETCRERLRSQRSDEQINAAFDFQLLEGIKTFEASLEGAIEGIAHHSQAPEISKRCVLGAKRPPACATLRQTGKRRDLLIGESRFWNNGGFRQEDSVALDHESH